MPYTKTWVNTNLKCEENLDRLELELAKLWNAKKNNTWADLSASRAFGQTYVAPANKMRVVIASINTPGGGRVRVTLDPGGVGQDQGFTDFSGYTTGQQPSDWTERDNDETWEVVTFAGGEGGQALRHFGDSSSMLTWNDPGTFKDAEVLTIAKTGTGDAVGLIARANFSPTFTLYGCVLHEDTDGVDRFLLYRRFGNVRTFLHQIDFPWLRETTYRMKLRVVGGDGTSEPVSLKAKVWKDGDPEPASWNLEHTDDDVNRIVDLGHIGVGRDFVMDNVERFYDWFSYGKDGAAAPLPGETGAGAAYVPGEVAVDAGGSDWTLPAQFIVPPGETYELSDIGAIACTVANWYEVDFDAAFLPRGWTHEEIIAALTKPNTYAEGVNGIALNDANFPNSDLDPNPPAKLNTEYAMGNVAAFILWPVTLASIIGGGDARIHQKDAGGAFTEIIRLRKTSAVVGAVTTALCCNAGGAVKMTEASGEVKPNSQFLNPEKWEAPLPSALLFNAGEEGPATAQKWKDLDNNAARGIVQSDMGGHVDAGVGTDARTISATRMGFASTWFRQVADELQSIMYVRVQSSDGGFARRTESTLPAGSTPIEYMVLVPVEINQQWDIEKTANVTIKRRTEWAMP